ncbi:MAG TPA: trimethyllysine dioxygenase [Dongiaceae bacterium]|jgi:trimethyllysine dioxygenase|nr:trimethyllysine dioxygenase [Dongiaceae bacterium]
MGVALRDVKLADRHVELSWADGRTGDQFSLLWLKDHCPSPQCLHPDTKQRQIDTFAIPEDIAARSVAIEENGRVLRIDWAGDVHVSRFEVAFLASVLPTNQTAPRRVLWDAAAINSQVPTVPHDAVMDKASDAGLKQWLELTDIYGFCIVTGTPATPEATQALMERVTYIRHTIFGGFWDFTANMEHKDTAYTTLAIGPHTDGTYSFDAPGYQMLHCLAFNGTGGENVFVDGFKVADIMRREHAEEYRLLTSIDITGQYIDNDRNVHLQASRPLFRLNRVGELVQVSYNNYDRAPFYLPAHQTQALYRALKLFAGYVNDPEMQYRRRLAPGDAVMFDNWRALHARDAYQGHRRLCGAYLNKEDVESRLRKLRARP